MFTQAKMIISYLEAHNLTYISWYGVGLKYPPRGKLQYLFLLILIAHPLGSAELLLPLSTDSKAYNVLLKSRDKNYFS